MCTLLERISTFLGDARTHAPRETRCPRPCPTRAPKALKASAPTAQTRSLVCRGLAIALALSGVVGCRGSGRLVRLETPGQTDESSKDYDRQLKRWTRRQAVTILKEMNTTLRIYATLQSPAFNNAYVAKRAAMFKLPDEQAAALRKQLADVWRESYPFILVVATHDRKWNDFDKKDSNWRLALFNDKGEQVDATSVEQQRRTTSTDRELFPHLEMFYKLYHVRFPKKLPDGRPLVQADTKRLILRALGSLGQAELRWRIQ